MTQQYHTGCCVDVHTHRLCGKQQQQHRWWARRLQHLYPSLPLSRYGVRALEQCAPLMLVVLVQDNSCLCTLTHNHTISTHPIHTVWLRALYRQHVFRPPGHRPWCPHCPPLLSPQQPHPRHPRKHRRGHLVLQSELLVWVWVGGHPHGQDQPHVHVVMGATLG